VIRLLLTNESGIRPPCTRATLETLAAAVLKGEKQRGKVEISVLYCNDTAITALNRQYRKKNKPTDVLSFGSDAKVNGLRILGDIVISLETVERFCASNRATMREEVRLLFCHGLLHLLGHDHATKEEEQVMRRKQAEYLGMEDDAAWRFGPRALPAQERPGTRGGGAGVVGPRKQ